MKLFHRAMLLTICAWLSGFGLGSAAYAQYNRGQISGFVRDQAGAIIPGANLTISSAAIAVSRSVTSGESGYYIVTNLPVGDFEVAAKKPGFKKFVKSGVRLEADARIAVDIELGVGETSETITVQANPAEVEVNSGSVERRLTGEQVRELALSGRNPFMLIGIVPGAIARGGAFLGDFRATSFSLGAFTINGGRKDTNYVTIDGVLNVRQRDNIQVGNILGIDFIEEVKIATSSYSAELGRSSGAQINFVTKRGTKNFHGTLFEFFGNDVLNARPFFTLPASQKPIVRYNNFGWALGGPVYLPKLWNQDRSRAFFFVGQEYRRLQGYNSKVGIVPTALERSGDFSFNLRGPDGIVGTADDGVLRDVSSNLPCTAPAAGKPAERAGCFGGNDPALRNRIPANRISPNGKALVKIFPLPNFALGGLNFLAIERQPTNSREDIYRADYNLRSNMTLSGRYIHDIQSFTSPFDLAGNVFPLFENFRSRSGNNFNLSLTTTLSSRMLNELSLGYFDFREIISLRGDGLKRETYGINFPEIIPGNRLDRIPNVFISPYTAYAGSGNPTAVTTPTYIFRDNLTRVMGQHTLKMGAYLEFGGMNDRTQTNDNGSFRFANASFNTKATNMPLADALLGNYDSYSEAGDPIYTPYRYKQFEAYFQDSWKATRRLTLDTGLRYYIVPPYESAFGNFSVFVPRLWDPTKAPEVTAGGVIVPNTGDIYNGIALPGRGFPDAAKGRFAQAADPSLQRLFRDLPKGFVKTRYNRFAPRLGFAYDLFGNGKTAIRGGYGLFYNRVSIIHAFPFGGQAPFTTAQVTLTNGSVDNPGGGTFTQIPLTALDIRAIDEDFTPPLVSKWNLSLQRELWGSTIIDVGYVGNVGRHLLRARQLNFRTPEQIRETSGQDDRRSLPYRGFSSLLMVETTANSSYNSLQVSVRKRMSRGVALNVAYTLSKELDGANAGEGAGSPPQNPLDPRSERSYAEEDRRHNLVLTVTYELPFFRAQQGVIGRILGGWSTTWVGTFNTGRHFNPALTSVQHQVATRPDLIGNAVLPKSERTLLRYFNTAAFQRPAEYTYGTSARHILVGPGTNNWDFTMTKSVRTWERVHLQFRAEFYNAFNHPWFNGIATTLGRADFGQINSVAGSRTGQASLKVVF